jgi:predicted deacetylase
MLVASIHDVAPETFDAVRRLRDALDSWGVARVTLLAVPDHHRRGRLDAAPAVGTWLRARVAAGDEVCLHGYHHLAMARVRAPLGRLRAALFTAGEGELLAVAPANLRRLIDDGKALVEGVLGARVRGFVAPAWLEPPGLARVLAAAGFEWHEDRYRIKRLDGGGARLAPVLGFATRSVWRERAALAWVRALGRIAPVLPVVRLVLHPADLASPAVMARAGVVARALVARRHAVTTAGCLPR